MTRTLSLLLCAFLAIPLYAADSLSPLRTLLTSLRGGNGVKATVDLSRNRKSAGRFANNQYSGDVRFGVTVDDLGLHITLPKDLLDQAARESREREADRKKMAPTQSALQELDPSSLVEALNFSEPLMRMLSIGTVSSEKVVNWHGRSARLLTLTLKEKLPPQATSVFNVQFQHDHLNLWLADDNTPLAAERVRKGSARFLILRGEMNSREAWSFARREDRLIVTRLEESFSASGFGQRAEGRSVRTVTIR